MGNKLQKLIWEVDSLDRALYTMNDWPVSNAIKTTLIF